MIEKSLLYKRTYMLVWNIFGYENVLNLAAIKNVDVASDKLMQDFLLNTFFNKSGNIKQT